MPEEVVQVFNSLSDVQKQEALDFMNFLKAKPRGQEIKNPKRQLDLWKGRIKMNPDFDAPLDCFEEYV